MAECSIRFFGVLNDLIPSGMKDQFSPFIYRGSPSVKHVIESLGVPHTEVDLIKLNDLPVGFDKKITPGSTIKIFPVTSQDKGYSSERLQKRWDIPPKFVLDNHLGQLAKYLRMLGFDAIYRNDFDDDQLAVVAVENGRILLTRDRQLLMRRNIQYGHLVRSLEPRVQLHEIVSRYSLDEYINPFIRCLECNVKLVKVEKGEILHRLEPLTKKYYEEFKICPICEKIYWKGSHYEKMKALIQDIHKKE